MIRVILAAAAAAVMLTACAGETDSGDKKVTSASTSATSVTSMQKKEKVPARLIAGESRDGEVILDSGHFKSASVVAYDSQAGDGPFYSVLIELDEEGKEIFAKATRQYLGEKISVWIGDECIFSPTVANEITDGKVVISELSYEKALETADLLNGGGD